MAENMAGNARIAELLNEAAVLLELSGENYFRFRAYQKAAQVIEGLTTNAASMTEDELTALRGIGKGIAGHIAEIAASGSFAELRALRKKIPADRYGAALNYFTGSKEHNVALRELAQKKGLTLSEYGLCRQADKEHKRPVAARTEEEIYAALGLAYIPPELREGRGELELPAKKPYLN